jgi:hypothetical protein
MYSVPALSAHAKQIFGFSHAPPASTPAGQSRNPDPPEQSHLEPQRWHPFSGAPQLDDEVVEVPTVSLREPAPPPSSAAALDEDSLDPLFVVDDPESPRSPVT